MDELMHKLVSAAVVAVLLAGVGALSAATRRRKVARAEAAAPLPAEDRSQGLLREAREHDRRREELAAQGRDTEALDQARAAVGCWRELTQQRQGRFLAERRDALARLTQLLSAGGQAAEAAQARQESANLA